MLPSSQTKKKFLRCVKQKDSAVVLDIQNKIFGRSAYLCMDLQCVKRASKTNILGKTFKINIDPLLFEELCECIKNLGENSE
ncbi:MAG: DUF448 domain-containing protein [Oscillospiraceae bacterium]|nr:DUF448 domain-containing protein [Oscillospiraceae bacterium]